MKIREIGTHKSPGLNEHLMIRVLDEPGEGNACREYRVHCTLPICENNPKTWTRTRANCAITFQKGNPNIEINGITNEVLLAIIEDRLTSFQAGKFACEENQMALEKVRDALAWLKNRTTARVERGVEGTQVK